MPIAPRKSGFPASEAFVSMAFPGDAFAFLPKYLLESVEGDLFGFLWWFEFFCLFKVQPRDMCGAETISPHKQVNRRLVIVRYLLCG